MLDASLVDVTDGTLEVEVADNELICSLLDITLVDVTDDDSSLLDKVLIEAADNVEDSSLLDTSLLTVADGTVIIPLLEMTLEEETDGVEISVLPEATLLTVIDVAEVISALFGIKLVDVREKEEPVANGTKVEIADNKELYSLLDITPVDIADDTAFSSLLNSLLVKGINVEVCSLLNAVLEGVIDSKKVRLLLDIAVVEAIGTVDIGWVLVTVVDG